MGSNDILFHIFKGCFQGSNWSISLISKYDYSQIFFLMVKIEIYMNLMAWFLIIKSLVQIKLNLQMTSLPWLFKIFNLAVNKSYGVTRKHLFIDVE